MINRLVRAGSVAAIVLSISACSSIGNVQPWQKGQLAKPAMAMDASSLEQRHAAHTYFSKEAASGGNGVGAGGCGCN